MTGTAECIDGSRREVVTLFDRLTENTLEG